MSNEHGVLPFLGIPYTDSQSLPPTQVGQARTS